MTLSVSTKKLVKMVVRKMIPTSNPFTKTTDSCFLRSFLLKNLLLEILLTLKSESMKAKKQHGTA